jgi:hypothetical protein
MVRGCGMCGMRFRQCIPVCGLTCFGSLGGSMEASDSVAARGPLQLPLSCLRSFSKHGQEFASDAEGTAQRAAQAEKTLVE